MSDAFTRAFAIVVGEEGGFSSDPRDPGNWTGGRVDVGALRGTRFGIAASAHPEIEDIEHLPLATAQAIYRRDYWDRTRGDELPPTLALLVFDAAVNSGVDRAVRWLQAALGVAVDGVPGPQTMAAVEASRGRGAEVQAELVAQRTAFLAALPTWRTFGLGWARRLARLPYLTTEMT